MKKALITGSAGFIGSNLASYLLNKGWEVYAIDNLSAGIKENLRSLKRNRNFHFYEYDISRRILPLNIRPKVIVHLAAAKIPRYGNSLNTLRTNMHGTENMLDVARKCRAKFIFASTSDVYGKSMELPFREGGDLLLGATISRRWAYASSKIFDEHLTLAYVEEYGVPAVILRFFGGYGPGQSLTWTGGPQGIFIEKSLKGDKIPIHGDGRQKRTFIYIEDLVKAIYLAMTEDKAIGEIINIGTCEEISIRDLAGLIWRLCKRKGMPPLKFIPYSKFSHCYEDVRRRIPDITKAKKILGFQPKICLEEGLSRMIEWWRSQRKI